MSLVAAPQKESNITFNYRYLNSFDLFSINCTVRLFQLCEPFVGHISKKATRVEGTHIFTGTRDMCNTTLLHSKFINSVCQTFDGLLEVIWSAGCTMSVCIQTVTVEIHRQIHPLFLTHWVTSHL